MEMSELSLRAHASRSPVVAVAVLALAAGLVVPAAATDVREPRTEVSLPEKRDGMSLLGIGVRTRTLLKAKVYAIGLYVADSALRRLPVPPAGEDPSPVVYRQLVTGDFRKAFVLRFVRDTTAEQVREAFYEALPDVDRARLDTFVSYFGTPKTGDEYLLRWAPGGVLQVTAAGARKPDIADKAFATAVFGIWLGEKPLQQDIKRDLIARLPLTRR
jgi:hypothetical protein